MKERFTKGEWVSQVDDCSACGEFEVVTDIEDDGSFYSIAENIFDEYDASLIAAAPKMYAMLEQLKAFTENMHIQPTGDTIKESVRLHEEVQKLLAAARGE